MDTVRSGDGTTIAYERIGAGPPVVMVVGAFNDRSTAAPLARLLAGHVTGYVYDRRGRGDSGDTPPYSVDREVDDLAALIDAAGGSAALFGYSSGAVLALKAAARGLAVPALALYEPPYPVDGIAGRPPSDLAARLAGLVAAGRRGDAVALFQTEALGMPEELTGQIRRSPFWPALEAMAHTVAYDVTITDDQDLPAELSAVTAPVLVLSGGRSPAWLREAATSVAHALPRGRHESLAGQTHQFTPEVLAPVLDRFLGAPHH